MSEQNFLELRKKVFAALQENGSKKMEDESKLAQEKFDFECKKKMYSEQSNERSQLLYLFYLEQYNLKALHLEADIKSRVYFENRSVLFLQYIESKKKREEINSKTTLYRFNDIIQKEARDTFDYSIQYLKQEKLTYLRLNTYLKYLKEHLPIEYEKNKSKIPKMEDVEKIIEKQEELEEQKRLLIKTFIDDKFVVFPENITTMDLMNRDVLAVVQKMYPNFKEKLLKYESQNRIKNGELKTSKFTVSQITETGNNLMNKNARVAIQKMHPSFRGQTIRTNESVRRIS